MLKHCGIVSYISEDSGFIDDRFYFPNRAVVEGLKLKIRDRVTFLAESVEENTPFNWICKKVWMGEEKKIVENANLLETGNCKTIDGVGANLGCKVEIIESIPSSLDKEGELLARTNTKSSNNDLSERGPGSPEYRTHKRIKRFSTEGIPALMAEMVPAQSPASHNMEANFDWRVRGISKDFRRGCTICGKHGHHRSVCRLRRCTLCNEIGHNEDVCYDLLSIPCQMCGKRGHRETHCRDYPCSICSVEGYTRMRCRHRRACRICNRKSHDEAHCWHRKK